MSENNFFKTCFTTFLTSFVLKVRTNQIGFSRESGALSSIEAVKRVSFKWKESLGEAVVGRCYTKIGILQIAVIRYNYFKTVVKILEIDRRGSPYLVKLQELY